RDAGAVTLALYHRARMWSRRPRRPRVFCHRTRVVGTAGASGFSVGRRRHRCHGLHLEPGTRATGAADAIVLPACVPRGGEEHLGTSRTISRWRTTKITEDDRHRLIHRPPRLYHGLRKDGA